MDAQPKKVLVLEGDEVVLVLLSHILARQAYQVHAVRQLREAEELLEQHQFSAMLVDIAKRTGGIELIRKLSEHDPAAMRRIIVVTGALHDLPHLNGFDVHSVIKKPFELHLLIDTVAECVSRTRGNL